MDYSEYFNMTSFDKSVSSTQCAVYDKTPGSTQRKINIVVRPMYSVGKVISDIKTQYGYDSFDLVLQPITKFDLVFLSDRPASLLFDIPGFEPLMKNNLILLPPGTWDGNTKQRFDLSIPRPSPNKDFINDYSHLNTNHLNNNNNSNHNNIVLNNIANSTAFNNNNNNNAAIGATFPAYNAVPPAAVPTSLCSLTSPHSTTVTSTNSVTDSLAISPLSDADQLSDDDLALGASASPTESPSKDDPRGTSPLRDIVSPINILGILDKQLNDSSFPPPVAAVRQNAYVGLVNQAMTCYLNSLLQALFMTPEFRNALYNWESDNKKVAQNIPFQLQKLFLKLQTSTKTAVETTDLTRSFGWDSTEAWQQHDIQELCRVMFDALEHKFRNTDQANLISTLYEGKMIDYVKCLECNTEKTRADTFLDIPLPVRPFGSVESYGSIEEALRAFVQPETLNGNNQYFCEKCNKKCDAHKGLKFSTFPYILTLHLKRFDFDYQTMHRIKLNDKVTFPQKLNLNSFVNYNQTNCGVPNGTNGNINGANGGIDDCCTTDSGSAMDEDNCSSGIVTASSSQHENDEFDEGIDISLGADQRTNLSATPSTNADDHPMNEVGPFIYELFAIMIHSGSATGGHYYAYIKEFTNGEWYCFNDKSVTPITLEDIEKSFGGSAIKSYYSSTYSSSTNAYMLMYRKIDLRRNEHPMKTSTFPQHINKLLPKLDQENEERSARPFRQQGAVSDLTLPELLKPRVYFYNPELKKIKVARVYCSNSLDSDMILESAYQQLKVDKFAPISRCRLVLYDPTTEDIQVSLEECNEAAIAYVRSTQYGTVNFLLESRTEKQDFEIYKAGGICWHVFKVKLDTMEVDGPFLVYSTAHERDATLLHSICSRLNINEQQTLLATLGNKRAFVALDPAPTNDAQENFQTLVKSKFWVLTYFFITVPSTDAHNLEVLGVPPYEPTPSAEVSSDSIDAIAMNGVISSQIPPASSDSTINGLHNDYPRKESPSSMMNNISHTAHESHSEDSSLSDGDRTLVESVRNLGGSDSQVSSASHSPQLSSPEDEPSQESYNRIHAYFNNSTNNCAETNGQTNSSTQFFYASKIDSTIAEITSTYGLAGDLSNDDPCRKATHMYKVFVNSHMRIAAFKKNLESLLHVPANYLKIQRKLDAVNPTHSLLVFNEGETLHIELGKVLQPDEQRAKIYYMRLSELDNDTGKLPCVCEWVYQLGMTVAEARKEIVQKMPRIDPKYKTLTINNCRLWLKGGRNPVKILCDDETMGSEVRTTLAAEFLIQECENGTKTETSYDSITIFVRRWYPDKFELGPFQEITLEKDTEIKAALSALSNIPEKQIAYTKTTGSFPCTNISLLSINGLNWFTTQATLDKYPLTTTANGCVYFYKDSNDVEKELNRDERRDLNTSEKARLDRLGCCMTSSSVYSPRRERALKIYLDSPPHSTTAEPSANLDDMPSTSRNYQVSRIKGAGQ